MQKYLTLAMLVASLSAPAFADGDAKAGKRVFKKCKACHSVKEDQHKVGPSLFGIVDASAGQIEGFNYSPALAQSGLVWDKETLGRFLLDPKGVVPGNRMSFNGLRKQKEIDDLIAYLLDVSN